MSSETEAELWPQYAENDRRAAENLFSSGDYSVCAELCQHMLEKAVKAFVISPTGKRPPFEHNLKRLIDQVSGVTVPSRIIDILLNVSPHYRLARYPGFADLSLYSQEYTRALLNDAVEACEWFLRQIK